MLRLITGGSGSGKSRLAEETVLSLKPEKRYYIATMIAWDEECRKRISRHRAMRAGKGFETLECPVDLEQVRVEAGSAVLLECLSNLTANEFFRGGEELADKGSSARQEASGGAFSPESQEESAPSCRDGCGERKQRTEEKIMKGIRSLMEQAAEVVVVTNEIFSDGTVYDRETMDYMEVLGRLNVRLAETAGEVTEVVFGIPLKKKTSFGAEGGAGR